MIEYVPDIELASSPQLELFPNLPGEGDTIEARFADFHRKNPHVYRNLRRMALDDLSRGRRRGMKALFEALRTAYAEAGIYTSGSKHKLNNSFTSHYARLLIRHEPRLVGHFELRTIRAI